MRKNRTIFGLTLSVIMLLTAFGVVMAQEGPPLNNAIFLPGEIASSGGPSTLEMPFAIQGSTVGEANVFCLAHPNTVAPNWPASATSAKGDVYTLSTAGNSHCLASEVEYFVNSASSAATSKEELALDLTFGPQPAGDVYTFTLRQIECGGETACRSNNAPVDVDLSIAAPTAIQLDTFGTLSAAQIVLPAILLLLAIGSLGYVALGYRQK